MAASLSLNGSHTHLFLSSGKIIGVFVFLLKGHLLERRDGDRPASLHCKLQETWMQGLVLWPVPGALRGTAGTVFLMHCGLFPGSLMLCVLHDGL